MIHQGSVAYGKVIISQKANFFCKTGKLSFTIDYIVGDQQTNIQLKSEQVTVKGGYKYYWLILGFLPGKNVTVLENSVFSASVTEEIWMNN